MTAVRFIPKDTTMGPLRCAILCIAVASAYAGCTSTQIASPTTVATRPPADTASASSQDAVTETPQTSTPTPPPAPPTQTPTRNRTATPSASPPSQATLTSDGRYAIYQFQWFVAGGVYAAWGMGDQGAFVPRFSYSSNRVEPAADASPVNSPARATYLSFAHFADKLAYWIDGEPSQLWISDLAGNEPQLIYSDDTGTYRLQDPPFPGGELRLIWSPDDRFIIVDSDERIGMDLIYDLMTDTLEPWQWTCNSIGFSERTRNLALVCRSESGNDYAVMEWGGEIWQTSSRPSQILVSSPPELSPTWAWSPDGTRVAFFDSTDPEWKLHVADNTAQVTELPVQLRDVSISGGLMHWLPEYMTWSANGLRLLVLAYGSEENNCPGYSNPFALQRSLVHASCWQVVDVTAGHVIWTITNVFSDELVSRYEVPYNDIASWRSTLASLSPDGNSVAFVMYTSIYEEAYVVDVTDDRLYSLPPSSQFRWGMES